MPLAIIQTTSCQVAARYSLREGKVPFSCAKNLLALIIS
jgi:hypothetical protein